MVLKIEQKELVNVSFHCPKEQKILKFGLKK